MSYPGDRINLPCRNVGCKTIGLVSHIVVWFGLIEKEMAVCSFCKTRSEIIHGSDLKVEQKLVLFKYIKTTEKGNN